ncbi:VOC family protein [Epibacterium ulvae]|uniref:VOC family protein n=1 Tax=Epibacterium ulvae TaxID=1156985 RepID=UPI002491DD35|nr:VOC family protein [Epibacterium ulvae]
MHPFHLAFPVGNLDAAKVFYFEVLGCKPGRESAGHWFDFDLFGHQMSAHLQTDAPQPHQMLGEVAGDCVPIPHFGVVLDIETFDKLADRLARNPDTDWILRPKKRMRGEPGEQVTMFVRDPSGNALEFKGFAEQASLFAM